MSFTAVAITAGLVALTCIAVSIASRRALVRTGNGAIAYFVWAFALLGIKNAVKSYRAWSGLTDTYAIESAFSIVDLVAVALIAWPIITRRRNA